MNPRNRLKPGRETDTERKKKLSLKNTAALRGSYHRKFEIGKPPRARWWTHKASETDAKN